VVKTGYYIIQGQVGGRISMGSSEDIYCGVFEDATKIYKFGQLPHNVHFEEPPPYTVLGTQ
jgi:hypothetical protein